MRPGKRPSGQALVEFALVFPLFLLLLFGLIDVGRAVFSYNDITNAAREGARLAIVNQTSASITKRITDQSVATPVTSCFVFLNSGATTTDCAATPNGDKCATVAVGCIASVEVTTAFQPVTPIIGGLVGNMNLTARTELPVEFLCPNVAIAAWDTSGECPKQP